jgi:hypothetical protein
MQLGDQSTGRIQRENLRKMISMAKTIFDIGFSLIQKDWVRRLPTTLADRLLREAKAKYDNHKGKIRHSIVINYFI